MSNAAAGDLDRIICEIHHLIPNIKVTLDDILNPKHEFVRTFCEEALNYYDKKVGYIATKEEKPLVMTSTKHFMDLGYDPAIAVYVRVNRIVKKIGNYKFTPIDFYKPSKQRTRVFLRMMLNFLLYVDNEAENIQQVVEQCTSKIGKCKQLENEQNARLEAINEKIRSKVIKEDELKLLEAGMYDSVILIT